MTETAFEILHYFSRSELEGMQMHSRFLRDFVDRNVDQLPLRPIYKISASPVVADGVHVSLEFGDEGNLFRAREMTKANLGLLFDRVNNAFAECLEINFSYSDGARFLRHLRDHAALLQFRIKLLNISAFFDHAPANFDYALVDFMADHLRPQELCVDVYNEQQIRQATLFDRPSLRSTIEHARFKVISWSAANCAIPGLLNVDALQTCIIDTHSDATPWIVRFMFEAAKRGAKVVRSVTIVRDRCDDDGNDMPAPTPDPFAALGKRQRRAIPALPASVYDGPYFRNADLCNSVPIESTAELFLVRNVELRKCLEISKWTVETTEKYDTFECTWPLDIFLLEIKDI